VLVRDFDGYPMGRGFINEHSKIRIRMMTRNIDQEINEAFLRKRVQDAWEYRKKVRHIKLPPDLWRGRLPAGTRSG
jgi:23S rRNA (cytosine1962-C5)-methyltransferase